MCACVCVFSLIENRPQNFLLGLSALKFIDGKDVHCVLSGKLYVILAQYVHGIKIL